jgi:hypothetical protein
MIPNCEGCKIEYEEIIKFSKEGLHFAGSGLYERGHLLMIMINKKREIVVE